MEFTHSLISTHICSSTQHMSVTNPLPVSRLFYKIAQGFLSSCRNPRPTQPSLNKDVKAVSEPKNIVSLFTHLGPGKTQPLIWDTTCQIWDFLLVYHITFIHSLIHSINHLRDIYWAKPQYMSSIVLALQKWQSIKQSSWSHATYLLEE